MGHMHVMTHACHMYKRSGEVLIKIQICERHFVVSPSARI